MLAVLVRDDAVSNAGGDGDDGDGGDDDDGGDDGDSGDDDDGGNDDDGGDDGNGIRGHTAVKRRRDGVEKLSRTRRKKTPPSRSQPVPCGTRRCVAWTFVSTRGTPHPAGAACTAGRSERPEREGSWG